MMVRAACVLTQLDYLVLLAELGGAEEGGPDYEPFAKERQLVAALKRKIEQALAEGSNVVIRPDVIAHPQLTTDR